MANDIFRTLTRTLAVALAAGLVIAGAYGLKPRSDVQNPAAIAQRAVKRPAAPGSEEALSRVIGEIGRGSPDYSKMSTGLAKAVQRGLPQIGRSLARLGPLRSLVYLGGVKRLDLYRASYRSGATLWGIALGQGGIIQGLILLPPGPLTPQDWIDNYSSFPLSERTVRMATQFGILLAAALFGRLALRLRL